MTIMAYALIGIVFMQLVVAYAAISVLKMALDHKKRNAEKTKK